MLNENDNRNEESRRDETNTISFGNIDLKPILSVVLSCIFREEI